MPRAIDHLVVAVPDLGAAVALYRAIGFTVGSRNLHPWKTENAVVQLDGAYLELIGLAPGFADPAPDDPAAPFASLVAAAVRRGGGLAAVALRSEDADADAAALSAAALGLGRRLDFGRDAEVPDGGRRRLRFSLAFADVPGLDPAALFACQHHQPFGDPASRRHPNGARRLDAAILAHGAPGGLASRLAGLFAVGPAGPPDRPSFDTPTGRLDVMAPADAAERYGVDPVAGRFVGLSVVVDAMAGLRAALDGAGVPHGEIAGAVVVPPAAAFGAALAFVPDACHSRR